MERFHPVSSFGPPIDDDHVHSSPQHSLRREERSDKPHQRVPNPRTQMGTVAVKVDLLIRARRYCVFQDRNPGDHVAKEDDVGNEREAQDIGVKEETEIRKADPKRRRFCDDGAHRRNENPPFDD